MKHVVDSEGVQATVESIDSQEARIRFEDGLLVSLPRTTLTEGDDGDYHVPFSLTRFSQDGAMVIPLVAEDVALDKRQVERQVRITKTVGTQDVTLEDALKRDDIDIERVAINRYIDEPLPVRSEGETTIIPLVEEVLVVEKRLLLREEIRVTRRESTTPYSEVYTLRREDVHVAREDERSK